LARPPKKPARDRPSHFPAGLSEGVWRAENGHRPRARRGGGDATTRTAKRVTDGGEPFPSRPRERARDGLVFIPDWEMARRARRTPKHERHGLFCFWDRDGALTELTDFVDGEERRTSTSRALSRARSPSCCGEGPVRRRRGAARQPGLRTGRRIFPSPLAPPRASTRWIPGPRATSAFVSPRRMIALAPTPGWGVFTASGASGSRRGSWRSTRSAKGRPRPRGRAREGPGLGRGRPSTAIITTATTVRRVTAALVLERLRRKDEAFAMARRVLAGNPEAEGLERFRSELAGWLKTLVDGGDDAGGAREVLGCGGERLGGAGGPIVAGEGRKRRRRVDRRTHSLPLAASLRDAELGAYEHEHEHETKKRKRTRWGSGICGGCLGGRVARAGGLMRSDRSRRLRGHVPRRLLTSREVLSGWAERFAWRTGTGWLGSDRFFCAMTPPRRGRGDCISPTWWRTLRVRAASTTRIRTSGSWRSTRAPSRSFFVGRMLDEHAFQPPPVACGRRTPSGCARPRRSSTAGTGHDPRRARSREAAGRASTGSSTSSWHPGRRRRSVRVRRRARTSARREGARRGVALTLQAYWLLATDPRQTVSTSPRCWP